MCNRKVPSKIQTEKSGLVFQLGSGDDDVRVVEGLERWLTPEERLALCKSTWAQHLCGVSSDLYKCKAHPWYIHIHARKHTHNTIDLFFEFW